MGNGQLMLAGDQRPGCGEIFVIFAIDDRIGARLAEGLGEHNRANPGGSTRITRVMMMTEPAAIDAGEVTDKGYINQRAVLARRAALVERLYAEPVGDDIFIIG